MVFTSALPGEALASLASAESMFRRLHEDHIAEDRKTVAAAKDPDTRIPNPVKVDKDKVKALSEKIARRPHITWGEDQVLKSTLVELLKTHYYGSFTYLDAVGARLGATLYNPARLASDLGWTTLMEGTTDETFIRANGTGGANIHSLSGLNPIFNFYCSCKEQQLEKLMDRIKNSPQGQVGIGSTVIIPGQPGPGSGTTADTLYSLARRVFILGEQPEEKRVKVRFAPGTEAAWQQFFAWTLPELLDEPELPDWQLNLVQTSPASPETAVRFGARAAMVGAFIQSAEIDPHGRLQEVELTAQHLEVAKAMARHIYREASGQAGMETRVKNLKKRRDTLVTDHNLSVAKVAIEEAISRAPN